MTSIGLMGDGVATFLIVLTLVIAVIVVLNIWRNR